MTSFQLTNNQVIANYRDAYEAFFGTTAPYAKRMIYGRIIVRFETELHCVTGMMREIEEANG